MEEIKQTACECGEIITEMERKTNIIDLEDGRSTILCDKCYETFEFNKMIKIKKDKDKAGIEYSNEYGDEDEFGDNKYLREEKAKKILVEFNSWELVRLDELICEAIDNSEKSLSTDYSFLGAKNLNIYISVLNKIRKSKGQESCGEVLPIREVMQKLLTKKRNELNREISSLKRCVLTK